MGAIYRAKQAVLYRDVAVKVMTSRANTPEMADRFRREALVLGRVEHPNIVPIYDTGMDEEGNPFYTMKLVRGRTLQEILHDLRAGRTIRSMSGRTSIRWAGFSTRCSLCARQWRDRRWTRC